MFYTPKKGGRTMEIKLIRILLLVDYRKQFYSSIRSSTIGFDIEKVKSYFNAATYDVEVKSFNELDFNIDYSGVFVLYQSSEDRDLLYKSYIEDNILALRIKGATLIPKFEYFACHHNKSLQELLIGNYQFEHLTILDSEVYGTYEDFCQYGKITEFPIVVKAASGCTSKGVLLAKNTKELDRSVKKLTSSFSIFDYLRFKYKVLFKANYIEESNKRRKIILQEFVPGLTGDYKVLVYGEKFYILERENRKNDFRASGSGLFKYLNVPPVEILEAANELFTKLDVPYLSVDLALSGKKVSLIEYQMLMFGTLTLEKSSSYFTKVKGTWILIEESPNLEKVFVSSIIEYINKQTC
jgi:hypothetical protein